MDIEFYKGRRLSYDGNLCTVRFFGEVKGTTGLWVGVEWDDASRGKHSGERNGVKYFECLSKHPTAGSFVRPNRPSDPARTFVQAVHEKYASETASNGTLSSNPTLEDAVRISGKEVKEVGFDKIRAKLADLRALKIVLVDGLRIHRPEARKESNTDVSVHLNDIKDVCPAITELDLSRSLLEEWAEVVDICRQLHDLRNLKADGNRFRDVHASTLPHNLKSLSLNETFLTWSEISSIVNSIKGVESLSANGNALSSTPSELPACCTSISLERNDFESLGDLYPLSKLPQLTSLKLKGNRISRISDSVHEPKKQVKPLAFAASLYDVDLSSNSIDSWLFIDSLNDVFPGMTSLRISNNPLYNDLSTADGKSLSADDGYMLTLARLGQIARLNFSQITPKERLNADTYYLSQIARELASGPEASAPDVLARHRRYAELCAEYGTPAVQRSATSVVDPNVLASRLVKLSVSLSVDVAKKTTIKSPLAFEVPRSLGIYALLGMVGKRLDLRPMELRLIWETGDWDLVSDIIDADDMGGGQVSERRVPREEVLAPRMRPLGSWIEGATASLRVEWNEVEVQRHEKARMDAKQTSIP